MSASEVLVQPADQGPAETRAAGSVGTNHPPQINGASNTAGQINQAFRFGGIDERVPDIMTGSANEKGTFDGVHDHHPIPNSTR